MSATPTQRLEAAVDSIIRKTAKDLADAYNNGQQSYDFGDFKTALLDAFAGELRAIIPKKIDDHEQMDEYSYAKGLRQGENYVIDTILSKAKERGINL